MDFRKKICFIRDLLTYLYEKNSINNISLIQDIYKGEKSFLIGSGPSIKNLDLRIVKNELIVSLNNGFVHRHYSEYMTGDNKFHLVAPIHKPQTYNDWLLWFQEMEKKIPLNVKIVIGITGSHLSAKKIIQENNLFSRHQVFYFFAIDEFPIKNQNKHLLNFDRLFYRSPTASIYGLHLLKYLGVNKIYTLGLDHNYILFDNQKDMRMYSSSTHQTDSIKNDRNHDFSVEYYLTQYKIFKCYQHFYNNYKDITVYNCSMDSLLRIFPKLPFDKVELN